MREARQGFREGARGVGALTEAGKQGLKQAGPILAADEAFKLLNEQSDNRQQAPTQPFMAGPDPSQSYYANMRALGETPSGGNPFEQSWM